MVLRNATVDDARTLWEWRNDPETRRNALQTEPIDWDTHQQWLAGRLADTECQIWILVIDHDSVGQVRYDRIGTVAEISIVVAPGFRGRGIGTSLLRLSANEACTKLQVSTVVGIVKDDNIPSQRAFERAGFQRNGTLFRHGRACHRFVLTCTQSSAT